MRRAILIGGLAFLSLIVVRIPAGVIRYLIPADAQATLISPRGTIWSGSGNLLANGIPTGRLSWSVRPVTFLRGRVGYDLELAGAGADLSAGLELGVANVLATVDGTVTGRFVNQWLEPYYIELSGLFEVQAVSFALDGRTLESADGQLTWDGGPLRYRLSGKLYDSALPAMTADLGPGPVAVAYATGESTPLLHAALTSDGFARFGVTKYLTRILGQPWPGGDPDHAVVLEVEEQVF
jgi:hypothetical protein